MMATKQSLAVIQAKCEALNWGNMDDLRGLAAADCVLHNQSKGRTIRGLDGYRAYLNSWNTAFPDFWAEKSHLAAGTQSGVREYVLRGAHMGTLRLPGSFIFAARQQNNLPPGEEFHIVNGRQEQIRTCFDLANLHQQLGLLPQLSADRAIRDGFVPPIIDDDRFFGRCS